MGADLVGAAGEQTDLEQRIGLIAGHGRIGGADGQTAFCLDGGDLNLVGPLVLLQEALDPLFSCQPSGHDALVVFFQAPVLKGLGHDLEPCQGLAGHDKAAGVPVQTVADRGAEGLKLLGGELTGDQQIVDDLFYQGAVALLSFLGEEAGRFVDQQDMSVLVEDLPSIRPSGPEALCCLESRAIWAARLELWRLRLGHLRLRPRLLGLYPGHLGLRLGFLEFPYRLV